MKIICYNKIVIITDLGDAMKNFSRQREEIIRVLRSTDTHPTAAWVYSRVKEAIPNISLGTVYRNLAALSKSGEILSLSVGDGFEHFDGNPAPHAHLHCRICGKIADAPMPGDPLADVAREHGFEPETSVYIEYGVCEECKKQN